MKIFNEFGIKPTTNHTAAGLDFYVPNIKSSPLESDIVFEAFSSSYHRTVDELKTLLNKIVFYVTSEYGEEYVEGNEMNLLLLKLAYDGGCNGDDDDAIEAFVDYILVFDGNKVPGLKIYAGDHVFINSGIHVALDPNTAGIFFNKSGRGVKGWDVRACVVDEDYTGFVHLSLSYTKDTEDGIMYCGDKIIQMVVLPIIHSEVEEVDKDMYESLMSNSQRGAAGFGSSDEKH